MRDVRKGKGKGGKAATGETPGKLVRSPSAKAVTRTEDEWQLFIDKVVDDANRGIRRGGLEHEGVADLLFKALYEKQTAAGLDPETNPNEAFQRVGERAGASLRLLPNEFVMYIRIGAMNQHRRDDAWLEMDWTKKALLVGLLALENGTELIKEGIELAGRANVGVRHVRDWVYSKIPKKQGTVGRPRNEGFTLNGGDKLAKAGVQLKSERQRRGFLKQLAKASPEKRRALVKDLRDALEGLQALVADLDALDDE